MEATLRKKGDRPVLIFVKARDLAEQFLDIAPKIKHESFSAEEEVRMALGPLPETNVAWKFRAPGSMVVPYVPDIGAGISRA